MRVEAKRGDGAVDKTPRKIAGMFDAIADRYDLLNTVLSAGLDRYWRRRAIASLQLTGREQLLDVCTGTADVAIGAARRAKGAARVVGTLYTLAALRRATMSAPDDETGAELPIYADATL